MSGEGIALIITACGTFLTAVASAAGVLVSLMNARRLDATNVKLEAVHQTTNSLAERAEKSAKEAGIAQGTLTGRAEVMAENKADSGNVTATIPSATIAIESAQVNIGNKEEANGTTLSTAPNKPVT